jgi:hypothetical protein
MAGTSSAKTRFALLSGHDEGRARYRIFHAIHADHAFVQLPIQFSNSHAKMSQPVIASQRVARMRARRQAPRSNPFFLFVAAWIASLRSQ